MSYADTVRSADIQNTPDSEQQDDEHDDSSPTNYSRKLVTNYVPPRENDSDDIWEYSYFRELIQLRNIFIEGVEKIRPDLLEYLHSPQFFLTFCRMVRKGSSGYIHRYLEDLTDEERDDYLHYVFKRNEDSINGKTN
uniref:Uncharacterized protein n=1 Tax=viral metagenome TaxID=1070528 RepID=A0A6C0ELV7_9ZZZZ